jgi:hypothetical protein
MRFGAWGDLLCICVHVFTIHNAGSAQCSSLQESMFARHYKGCIGHAAGCNLIKGVNKDGRCKPSALLLHVPRVLPIGRQL